MFTLSIRGERAQTFIINNFLKYIVNRLYNEETGLEKRRKIMDNENNQGQRDITTNKNNKMKRLIQSFQFFRQVISILNILRFGMILKRNCHMDNSQKKKLG